MAPVIACAYRRAMDATTAFAANLKRLRTAAGDTQLTLGRRAGISATYVGELERGEKSPSLTTVVALAETLGVAPADMVKQERQYAIKPLPIRR